MTSSALWSGRPSVVLLFLLCVGRCSRTHGLSLGDAVAVSMNKVWPQNNPTETYSYYDALPVCQPSEVVYHHMTFGQIMRGDRLVNSLYNISFNENRKDTEICTKTFSMEDVLTLQAAIDSNYVFEIYVADLPVIGPIGMHVIDETGKHRYLVARMWDFNLGYNEGEVISINITTQRDMVDVTTWRVNMTTQFAYSVNWEQSTVPASSRLQMQLAGALTHPTQALDIHWLSIINSFVLVMLVVSMLFLIILRVVRSDLSRYLHIPDEELAAGMEEETGWKLLHADVFRPPAHRMWICACVGGGAHLFLVSVATALVGCFAIHLQRGAVQTAGLFAYMLTSFTAGYISANLYGRLGGIKPGWNMVITALMFMGPVFVVWSILNTMAILYSSTAALPFRTVLLLFSLWLCVTLPLTILGGVLGRRHAQQRLKDGKPFPCKTNKLAREIPTCRWYQSAWIQIFMTGFLSFRAIAIELHYVFASVWGNKIYTLYGVLLMAFIMLILVAASLSVLFTYFHLNSEDHQWWWRALLSGGSVALFFFVHCAAFFITDTRMFGVLQISFFFGYSLVISWGIFLTMGFITFASTFLFVQYIYRRIKSD